MKNVLNLNLIQKNVDGTSKEDILRQIAKIAKVNQIIYSEEQFYKDLLERENDFTTGFGKGIAIPHCKSDAVKQPSAIVVKTKNEIDWESIDGLGVNMAIGLAVPKDNASTEHLRILSMIARAMMNQEFVNELKMADTEKEIYDTLMKIK